MDFPTLAELRNIVKTVACNIAHLQSTNIVHHTKLDGSFVTVVDHMIQDQLQILLRKKWSKFGFIGEEMEYDDQVRICEKSKSGYWVIDPLDGTTNFIYGLHFYGISIALVVRKDPVLAVIYDPVRDECFSAERGKGARMNGSTLNPSTERNLYNCIANLDYKRLNKNLAAQLVTCPPYRSQRNLGSSVLEWCWLAAGRFHLYLNGGQKLWDFSAGYLILLESGGAATSLSGLPLDCSQLKKRSVVAAVNPDLLKLWINWIHKNSHVRPGYP